jgi:hypothetical protein
MRSRQQEANTRHRAGRGARTVGMHACTHCTCSGDVGEIVGRLRKYQTIRPARVIAGRDDASNIARASVTVQQDVAL